MAIRIVKEKSSLNRSGFILIGVVAVFLIFNQVQLSLITSSLGIRYTSFSGGDLSNVNINEIKSTADAIAALFPVQDVRAADDAISMIVPRGVPEYGAEMGISFDDPVVSLDKMASGYNALKAKVETNPEVWSRYLNLAANPRGISCEFCCGIGAQGVDAKGKLRCGCKHNPAVQTLTFWLMLNTDYTDAEILKEVMRWKAIWFPKYMVELTMKVAGNGGQASQSLPEMVGGC